MRAKDLAALLGEQGMRALVARYGGQHIYVGERPGSELVAIFGAQLASKLSRACAGNHIEISRLVPIGALEIASLRRLGFSINQIAERTQRSSRSVRRALKKHRAAVLDGRT